MSTKDAPIAPPKPRIPAGRYIWGVVLDLLIVMFCRLQVVAAGNVPKTGAGIVYYNHIHWLDPVLICGSFPRYAVPLTKIEASSWPVVGALLRWYHVIFITRGQVDRDALKATWELLEEGGVAIISPEGTRSPDAALQEAKEGLAFIARRTPDAWLIPCAVTGTPGFSMSWKRLFDRQRIVLTYGQPFKFCWPDERADRDELRAMTDEAMTHLAALLPPEMQGDYTGVAYEPHWCSPLSDPIC